MKSFIILTFILQCALINSVAQHLIGFNKNEVTEIVRKEMKGFSPDNSSVNHSFNYLKFINAPGTKTLIVFLDENNVSSYIRLVCDYSEYDLIIAEFNSKYKSKGKFLWEYPVNDKTCLVTLEEKEWYFVVYFKMKPESTEPENKSWLWRLLN